MGPSRFERESEDPQSPRMARLPYGPALILFADIPYVSCYLLKKEEDPGAGLMSLLKTVLFKFLDLLDQAVEFMIGDLHLSFDRINLM